MRHILTAVALSAICASAQPAFAQASDAQELYHLHFVKAAPGKLADLIDVYQNAPVPAGKQKPVILRHREGDDWDLLVVTPYGEGMSHRISAAARLRCHGAVREGVVPARSGAPTRALPGSLAGAQKAFAGDGIYVVAGAGGEQTVTGINSSRR